MSIATLDYQWATRIQGVLKWFINKTYHLLAFVLIGHVDKKTISHDSAMASGNWVSPNQEIGFIEAFKTLSRPLILVRISMNFP